jgi:hypothetical protein
MAPLLVKPKFRRKPGEMRDSRGGCTKAPPHATIRCIVTSISPAPSVKDKPVVFIHAKIIHRRERQMSIGHNSPIHI